MTKGKITTIKKVNPEEKIGEIKAKKLKSITQIMQLSSNFCSSPHVGEIILLGINF